MTTYLGMNSATGSAITDIDHLRQSVRDILLTPQGSRIARREYGSVLFELIDQPQNPALRLQLMAAVYVALTRWESRLALSSVTITNDASGAAIVDLVGQQFSGQPVSLTINVGG